MRACTIIAKNYIAQARVLARSFLEHHPDSEFSVLIIDELDGVIDPESEPFTVLTPRDISCEPFVKMAARYDVLELSTAVKPWLLRQQLALSPTITYLDPDIQVFAPLTVLEQRVRDHGLVLTPHNTEPIPLDGERPTQIDIMIAGVYNLGYVSIGRRPEIEKLIDWWTERLRRDCRVDPVYGYFVDQRWFDLAPGFVSDYAIVREPEYNVAYWNAHSRRLSWEDGRYTVNGRPLAFFHFSGFDPSQPELLSRHQTRIRLPDQPALARICSEYGLAVAAAGYAETHAWPYTYARLPDGSSMTPALRSVYARGEDVGALQASPFDSDGCEAFLTWAGTQQEGAPAGINRALAAAYGARADLRAAFPDLEGGGGEHFLRWAHEHVDETGLPERLLGEAPATATPVLADPQPEREPDPPRGVNVVGYFRSELGVGEAARQAVSALDSAGIPLLPLHGATIPLNRQWHEFRQLDHTAACYPVNLICMNADALPEFAHQAGPEFFENRYSIGLWFWEVTKAPRDRWKQAFEHLDEVWVPTRHVAEAVTAVSPLPVFQVTIPIEMAGISPTPRRALGLPDGFLFLFAFDYLSVFARKNPVAIVEAFTQAFEPGSGAKLAIKCINHEHDAEHHQELMAAVSRHPDIQVLDQYLAPENKNALIASCDCYVSLHRSEGFGLTMAEAMYVAKPVIATGYSGNLDFMTSSNSYLVDYTLAEIGPDAGPYPADGVWAEPDVEHAAGLMRAVYDDPAEASQRAARGTDDIRRTHSAAAAGAKMAQRLELILEKRGTVPHRSAVAPGLGERIDRGPVSPQRSAAGPLGPPLRRALLRLMKPFTAHERTVDGEMLRSLQTLERGVRRVAIAQQRSEAADLAGYRKLDFRVDALRHQSDGLRTLPERVYDLSGRIERVEAEERAIPHMSTDAFVRSHDPIAGFVQGYKMSGNRGTSDVYRSFEDIFRGSEEFIRGRQQKFLELIGDRQPVLDFGCGRGEFIDLLRERGTPYVGVDSDVGMVTRCRQKGHELVVLADGIEYLDGQAAGSLGAIFCAQVIEHLPYPRLLRFFDGALRALAADGLLIAETVNPHSPSALKTFWVDLTHQHPIFPEVALALCGSAGFAEAFVFHPNGRGDAELDRYVTGEYAVVARVASRPETVAPSASSMEADAPHDPLSTR